MWAVLPAASGAGAEPLSAERCEALASELALLEGGGAGQNIKRTPEWAKQNLTPEQINYVRRLIAVREDLLFKCRSYDVVRDPPPPSMAPADAPLPERKPAVPQTAKSDSGLPLPARPRQPSDVPAKPEPSNAKKQPAAAPDAAKPQLRGTLAAPPKQTTQAVPAPVRKGAEGTAPRAASPREN